MQSVTFGQTVRSRRKELGLTAEELAKKTGIVRTYVSRIERHNFIPSLKVLERLIKVLGREIIFYYFKAKAPDLEKFSNQKTR